MENDLKEARALQRQAVRLEDRGCPIWASLMANEAWLLEQGKTWFESQGVAYVPPTQP